MKYLFAIIIIASSLCSFGQETKEIEKTLIEAFSRINYWSNSSQDISGDSLINANNTFEELLLKYTSSNNETLSYKFKSLSESGVTISTSKDNRFRIYSWNTLTGGTMRFYRNVFQFMGGKKVYSKTLQAYQTDDNPDCLYHQIDDVRANNKNYYITQNISIESSSLYYHNVKIFCIDGSRLNDTTKLIKTKTAMRNELGYEVDLQTAAISHSEYPNLELMYIKYDDKKQIIYIPLIDENGRVTKKKIKYKFNGRYFETI